MINYFTVSHMLQKLAIIECVMMGRHYQTLVDTQDNQS